MPSAFDRSDFGPPRDAGAIRSFGLALLVHAALIAALTWGVNWKRSDPSVAFEAELWSSVPQEAAPKLIDVSPAPPPPPPPPPPPAEPAPKAQPKAQPAAPQEPQVDIALSQEKKRKLQDQQKLRDAAEAKADALAEKERKLKQELAKLKAAEDTKKAEIKKQAAKEQATAAASEEQRKQNIARSMGLAGATGGEAVKGSALTSSGPSAGYKSKLAALFKRNITFSNVDSIQGNPRAIVQVKVSSSGLIMSSRLTKSSGIPAWDEAVLRAVEKAERIPQDENGKVVTDFPVDFGPKD